MTTAKTRRTVPKDPTPQKTLERIADAVNKLTEQAYIGMTSYRHEDFEAVYAKVNLADIRREVAREMQRAGERFSSDYRHEDTPMHAICLHILGSTVMLNALCDKVVSQ